MSDPVSRDARRRASPRLRDAGDAAILLELGAVVDEAVNARAIAIAAAMRDAAVPGVRDVVSTYRSVAVYFDPLVASDVQIRHVLSSALESVTVAVAQGRSVEIPVVYGGSSGPDLGEVAAFAGLDPVSVVRLHSEVEYRVYMLGFLPGFAYLGPVDRRIAAPRRATPRLRVPAGSVGIAGEQTGIYPLESPGGWQVIGRTPIVMFDSARTPSSLLVPGDRVRFLSTESAAPTTAPRPVGELWEGLRRRHRSVTVMRPGWLTTVQDRGRWGHQAQGVPVSGALDAEAFARANTLLGNEADAAVLEVTIQGPELRIDDEAMVAVTGADLGATADGAPIDSHRAARIRAGGVLRFGVRQAGARAYVAFDGGIAITPTLGSRATHVGARLGGVGGRALVAGDRLPLGAARAAPAATAVAVVVGGDGARVRVLPGPQDEFFSSEALDLLQRTRFVVSSRSDRMGYRLVGGTLPRLTGMEMISDATFVGGIQVPPSGEPILLMADRQTTGGYPQIAIVITADLPRVAQLAPGDWIEFAWCSKAEARSALRSQQRERHGVA